MATRQQLEQALQNPNVRQFLDLIAHTEGTEGNGYHTAFGGGRIASLKDHPRYLKSFTQKNGKVNKTSAAGRYQFIRKTWDNLARQYSLSDFGPKNQDLGAVALLAQNGSLPYILKGDWQTAVKKSGPTWASLPSAPKAYSQPTRSWQSVAKFMGGNTPSRSQQPQADPRLSMSAPDLLATLRKDSKRSDNDIFIELANNNGRAGQEVSYLLSQGHNPADIAQQLGLNISVAQPPQDDIDLPDIGDGYESFMANLTAQDAPEPQVDLPDIGSSYEDFMSNLTLDEPQPTQAGDTWQTQKTLSDSMSSGKNAKARPTAKSSWESLS